MLQMTIKETIADPDFSQYQKMSLKEILEQPVPKKYDVYHISDGETIFYIGQSKNPRNRLLSHLGLDGRSNFSPIGKFILKHAPTSNAWLFVQYTIEDCKAFVEQYYHINYTDIDHAEASLIKYYRPHFNIQMNSNPSPLPDKYIYGGLWQA